MLPIRIFRHIDCEGPGYFQAILESRQIPYEVIRIDEDEPVNSDLETTSGLLFMGGSMSANDDLDWLKDEISLIKQAVKHQVPVMGICLGSQLMARAMGARVYRGDCMEIGWGDVDCINHTPWTDTLPSTMTVFHWHGETFDIPTGAIRLFGNKLFANQGFALGPHLALQFHIEMQSEMIVEWLNRYPEDLEKRCIKDHDSDMIKQQMADNINGLQNYATTLFTHWLSRCLS